MSKTIRVLHVFSQMNRGGAETMIMNLYRNIDRNKVQFDFIVHTKKPCSYDDEIRSLGGYIYHIPRYTGKNHFQYIRAWNEFFLNNPNYKIIHGHVRSTATIYLGIAQKKGLTTIAHSHSTSSGKGIPAIVKNFFQYPIRNKADYFFACSQPAGEWLFGKEVCEKENYFILKNAIEAQKFVFNQGVREEKRNELGIQENFVIGHVGRFDNAKNQNFLIDVFKEVHNKNKGAILLLIGDGILRTSLTKKVEDLGLAKNVIFTGVRSDIPELYQAMDIFVFPSRYEGLGIAVVEAQASGLKCIVSDNVPKEAFLTDLIVSLSLQNPLKDWVEIILENQPPVKRKDLYKKIRNAGYDISDNIAWIENFYSTI